MSAGKLVTLECTNCQQPAAKRQKTGKRAAEKEQPQSPNYKLICKQLTQRNQQVGKAYKSLKAQFDELEKSCQDKDEQLTQAQQDADEMTDLVRHSEQRVAAYKEELREKDQRIKVLEQQPRAMQNSAVPSPVIHEAAGKVDRNDLHRNPSTLSGGVVDLQEKKCSLNNAYGLAGTASSTIRDFLGIAELRSVNEVAFQSTLERLEVGSDSLPLLCLHLLARNLFNSTTNSTPPPKK